MERINNKFKGAFLVLFSVLLFSVSVSAQNYYDDVYYSPSKDKVIREKEKRVQKTERQTVNRYPLARRDDFSSAQQRYARMLSKKTTEPAVQNNTTNELSWVGNTQGLAMRGDLRQERSLYNRGSVDVDRPYYSHDRYNDNYVLWQPSRVRNVYIRPRVYSRFSFDFGYGWYRSYSPRYHRYYSDSFYWGDYYYPRSWSYTYYGRSPYYYGHNSYYYNPYYSGYYGYYNYYRPYYSNYYYDDYYYPRYYYKQRMPRVRHVSRYDNLNYRRNTLSGSSLRGQSYRGDSRYRRNTTTSYERGALRTTRSDSNQYYRRNTRSSYTNTANTRNYRQDNSSQNRSNSSHENNSRSTRVNDSSRSSSGRSYNSSSRGSSRSSSSIHRHTSSKSRRR